MHTHARVRARHDFLALGEFTSHFFPSGHNQLPTGYTTVAGVEAIEATRLTASTPSPCTRASAGRRPLVAVVRSIEVGEVGVVSPRGGPS